METVFNQPMRVHNESKWEMPKVSFWAMHLGSDLQKTLRNGLMYLIRVITEEDRFAHLRYYVRDLAFLVELLA